MVRGWKTRVRFLRAWKMAQKTKQTPMVMAPITRPVVNCEVVAALTLSGSAVDMLSYLPVVV